jgi:hypothetical protein
LFTISQAEAFIMLVRLDVLAIGICMATNAGVLGADPQAEDAIPEMQKVVNDFFVRTLMHPETAKEVRRWKR